MANEDISRPTKDAYFMELCNLVSTRSTCLHRHQGAVIVRDNRVIASGYNGSPPGMPHCVDTSCNKDNNSGMACRAEGLHGESNAIISAAYSGVPTKDATIYCIYSPCRACCNMIKVAGIICVIYRELYSGFIAGPSYLTDLKIPHGYLMHNGEVYYEWRS